MATRAQELAERIYVDMVCRIALTPTEADKPKPTPEAIAKMSFRFAEAFMRVAEDGTESAAPKAKYEVQLSDVGG